jgi:hypothetical protein
MQKWLLLKSGTAIPADGNDKTAHISWVFYSAKEKLSKLSKFHSIGRQPNFP